MGWKTLQCSYLNKHYNKFGCRELYLTCATAIRNATVTLGAHDAVEVNSIPGVEVDSQASYGIEDEEPAPTESIEVTTNICSFNFKIKVNLSNQLKHETMLGDNYHRGHEGSFRGRKRGRGNWERDTTQRSNHQHRRHSGHHDTST